jgi:hypothetical protein
LTRERFLKPFVRYGFGFEIFSRIKIEDLIEDLDL